MTILWNLSFSLNFPFCNGIMNLLSYASAYMNFYICFTSGGYTIVYYECSILQLIILNQVPFSSLRILKCCITSNELTSLVIAWGVSVLINPRKLGLVLFWEYQWLKITFDRKNITYCKWSNAKLNPLQCSHLPASLKQDHSGIAHTVQCWVYPADRAIFFGNNLGLPCRP